MRRLSKIMLAAIGCVAVLSGAARADDYASKNGWQFRNFHDDTFSWDIYRDTFIGIPPTEDALSSGFDVLFYEQAYKSKLSKDGNCYGMSLLNLMIQKNGGHLGFCAPIPQYSGDIAQPSSSDPTIPKGPTNLALRRAINIMHGHQVNLPTVQFLLDLFAQHKNRDAQYAFDQFNYWHSRGDLTLVSITSDLNPADGGHTLVAYRADDLGGGNKKIFVLDPNRTWGDPADHAWYDTESNFIQINGNAWSFNMGGATGTWSGNPGSGGNLVIIPTSVTGPHARSPASLGDTVIGKILNTLLLTGSGASIEQVTDATGRRLYRPNTFEIDTDPTTGMVNTLPWMASDLGSNSQPGAVMLFQIGPSGGALTVSVRAGAAGYTLSSLSGRTVATVTEYGGNGRTNLTIRNPGTVAAGFKLEGGRGASSYDVQFTHTEVPGQRARKLTASQLSAGQDGAIDIGLVHDARGLRVASPDAALRYNLELATTTRQGRDVLAKTEVAQQAGTARAVFPRDWRNLKDLQVFEQVQSIRVR